MKIAIVGCGNMGMAFARSFIQYDLVKKETWYSDEVILIIAPKFASILSNTQNAKSKKKTT